MTYAEVAINTAVNQTFHYAIPPSWQSRLVVGHLVRVSFGTAMQAGIVVAIHDELPPELHDVTMKPIIDVLHPEPVMVQAHIDLALWMSEAYLASPGTCLWLMLPPGIVGKSTQQVFLGDAQPDDPDSLTTTQQKILEALNEEAPRSVDELVKITDVKSVRRVIKQLEEANLVEMTAVLNPPTATRKTVRTVMRAIPEDEVVDALASLQRAPKQTSVFAYIAKHDYPLDVSDVYEAIDATSADLNNLERKGFVELGERIVFRDSLADRNFIPSQPLALTTAQNDVWQRIRASLQQNYSADSENIEKDFLLHGVTGAGKTEIYLHAIAETLAQGRQALFLVPEIALTPQTIRRVAQRFPEKVAVVHGSLSTGERFDTWRRARDGDISVIVGTRSALFTPLPDVGLIILDESHDHSYKQSPPINPPYYNARDVAQKLAKLNDATLIFGSATP
ncbi:MAG: DEAD/DEAH box helicase family protein, partial [Chloroflexota bacterium]